MNNSLKKRIRFYLQLLGFHIGKFTTFELERFPSPKQLNKLISSLNEEDAFKTIKNYCSQLKLADNHLFYNQVLKLSIPASKLTPVDKAIFIGEGGGESSFNTFRKMHFDDSIVFEKICKTNHNDFKRLVWFEENLREKLESRLQVPGIIHIEKGSLFTVIYFEFLNLFPLTGSQIEKESVETSLRLSSLTTKFNLKKLPGYLLDFESFFRYRNNIEKSKRLMTESGLNYEDLMKKIKSIPKTLTHGDIQVKNLFQNKVLVDWDSYGFYPIGMEEALIYYKLFEEESYKGTPEKWLKSNYSNKKVNKTEELLLFSFHFFLFVFYSKKFLKGEKPKLLELLVKELKNSFN